MDQHGFESLFGISNADANDAARLVAIDRVLNSMDVDSVIFAAVLKMVGNQIAELFDPVMGAAMFARMLQALIAKGISEDAISEACDLEESVYEAMRSAG